ncbi:DNA recombination protein RmuC [Patescibacteria group bacterium]|nr:DNA recombination protein RmuC [Patescibacteria group bacterium]
MTTLIFLIINTLGIVFLIFLFFKNKKSDNTDQIIKAVETFFNKNEKGLKDEMSLSRKETADSEKRLREELSNLFKGFGDSFDKRMSEFASTQNKNFEGFSIKLTELIDKNDVKMEKVREVVEKKLESLQKDNSEKLEAMRVTVDEKLHATLKKRFGESFKLVSDRLDLVHKGLGEMQVLANGVGDLKKVLNNVKTRGTWGEAQLGNLIEEIFTPDQYGKNVKTKKTSKDNVEYAIKLPGNEDGKHIWLPIDAKFPLEDYQKLIEAQDQGDIISVEEFGKSLENRIKSEAKDIRDKYIDVPNTTDFGILFVPTESLYAEILRRPGLYELLRKDYKVIITGPTTIQVILNSLQVGFRTLNIQKRSGEVWTVLSTIKNEFGKFGDLLEKTHKKIQETSNTIEDAITKTRTIEKKLNKVQDLPAAETEILVLETPDDNNAETKLIG